eukprot:365573-Rhodomonas_salina.3
MPVGRHRESETILGGHGRSEAGTDSKTASDSQRVAVRDAGQEVQDGEPRAVGGLPALHAALHGPPREVSTSQPQFRVGIANPRLGWKIEGATRTPLAQFTRFAQSRFPGGVPKATLGSSRGGIQGTCPGT